MVVDEWMVPLMWKFRAVQADNCEAKGKMIFREFGESAWFLGTEIRQ